MSLFIYIWDGTWKMNLSRKNLTVGKNRAKKGRIMKSSYVGYDSCRQSMDLKVSVKPISDSPSTIQIFLRNKQSLAVDHECKQRHPSISLDGALNFGGATTFALTKLHSWVFKVSEWSWALVKKKGRKWSMVIHKLIRTRAEAQFMGDSIIKIQLLNDIYLYKIWSAH